MDPQPRRTPFLPSFKAILGLYLIFRYKSIANSLFVRKAILLLSILNLEPVGIGNRYQAGHEDEIMTQEVTHVVTVPTDPQSGQPSGQRVHKPFVFTCSLNKSVPLLYNALTKGEKLNNVEVKWYRTSTGGGQEHFFSTIFEDAVITDISLLMPNAQDPSNSDKTEQFRVSLNYRKILWEHVASGTSGSDDWRNA